jgi:hypothetical protein
MALTRPRLGQLTTSISSLSDPITVLHAGATSANVDIGFLMNRANGLLSNVALYWSESGNTFVLSFTSNTGTTDSNITPTSYANLTVGTLTANTLSVAGGGINGVTIGAVTPAAGTFTSLTASGIDLIANLGSQTTSINTINTNISSINANLGVYQTYANTAITSLYTNANANTAAYLANGISANVRTTGNIFANTTGTTTTVANLITTNGIFWANGTAFVSGSGTAAGNITPVFYTGTITATTSPTLIDTLPTTGNVYLQWKVTAKDTVNSRFRSGIVDSINDGTNVYYNEYAVLKSNPTYNVVTFTSNISGGNINLYATADAAGTTVVFERTVLGTTTPSGYINSVGPQGITGTINSTTGYIITTNTTPSTSTTTGAMQIAGGAGIAQDLYVGGNINIGVATFYSTTVSSIGTGAKLLDSFSASVYRSAKYLVSVTDVTNSGYQTSEIVLMQDGTNSTISSYGLVYSGNSTKMTFSSNIVSGNVMVWGTGASANNTVKLVRTLITI